MRMTVIAHTLLAVLPLQVPVAGAATPDITVRTERFPRPPYSGATYYIYEQDKRTLCTKLEVCDKYDNCDMTYVAGSYKDPLDVQTGDPYGTTPPAVIAPASRAKHVCLTRFGLGRP